MSNHQHAEHFTELVVWRKARGLARDVFGFSKSFPDSERYSLTDQVRRSSRSIGAQIAEAWAKRRYERHFVSKLTDADGEQNETQHWLIVAFDCGYLSKDEASKFGTRCKEIGAMLGKMISVSDQFCGELETKRSPVVRETDDTTEFFVDSPSDYRSLFTDH